MTNKIYIVFEDNGEAYEDYDKWIDKIFDTQEQAKRYIKNSKGKEKRLCEKRPYHDVHDFWLEEHEIERSDSNVKN